MLVFATKMIDGGWIDESQRKVISCESVILPFCFMQSQSVVHCIYNWQYVVLSSDRKVIFENGKTYNRPSAIVIVIKRMKNLSQVIKAKNDNWTDLLVFRLGYGIYACACAIVHWQCTMESQHVLMTMSNNAMCFAIKMYSVRNRLDTVAVLLCNLYPFLVFSNENSTSFFLEPKQKLLSNCTYRKRWNNIRHLESTFVASSPFDTVEISKQNTLKTFLCRFFSTTIRPCNNALTWSISHVSVSSINCDHKSNQWKSNDYSFQAVRFYSIGIVLPFINLDDYCKSFMLHFLHIGAVLFFRLL